MDKKTATLLLVGGGLLLLTSASLATERRSTPNANVTRWDDLIHLASQATGVSPAMIAAVIEVESNGNSQARGTVGEIGLMQIECDTAKQVGFRGDCQELFDPQTNIIYGARYLRWQGGRYNGDVRKVFSAYNAGSATDANVTYVNRALSRYQLYLRYY